MNLTSIAITPFAQGIIKVDCDRDETTNALKTRSSMVVSARHHAVGEGSLSAPKLVEHPIQEHLMALEANKAADAIVEIPVKLFFNKSVNSIAIQYKAYDQETGAPVCAGDGKDAVRVTIAGDSTSTLANVPCPGPERCAFAQSEGNACRRQMKMTVQIDGQNDPLSVFEVRSSSINNFRALSSQLMLIERRFGGLRHVPLNTNSQAKLLLAEQSLQSLSAAIFDRTECNGCQFNTGLQQAMFDTSFSGTRCTNKECYQGKTEAELQSRAKALTETYQVVRIVRAGDNSTAVPLRAEGPKGVGNRAARLGILRGLENCMSGVRYWLDTGNRSTDGQVVLGQVSSRRSRNDDPKRLPHIAEFYPDLIDSAAEDKDNLPSCSLAEALEKQSLYLR